MKYLDMYGEINAELSRDPDNLDLIWCFETRKDAERFRKSFYRWRSTERAPFAATKLSAFIEPDRNDGWCIHIFMPKFPEDSV